MMSSMWSILLTVGLLSGVWVSVSSGNWLGVWMGLELNLLCFIPLMIQHQDKKSSEVSVVYFLIQACGSFIILMMSINMMNYSFLLKTFINTALLLKAGAAPLHFWYVMVASELNWGLFTVLSTLQKVAPLVLLVMSSASHLGWLVYVSISMCGVVGGLGGVNSLSYRKILVYSSINHLGWVLIPLVSGSDFWIQYFGIYCIMLMSVTGVLWGCKVFHISQFINNSYFKSMALLVSMLSLMGFPPLLGFLPKWGVIMTCVSKVDLVCMSIMILSSVVSAFFYIRASFVFSLMGSMSSKLSDYFQMNMGYWLVVLLNLLGFWFGSMLM